MFKVEENLLLTKNQVSQDSYVLEDCSTFFPELAGFYVCVPRENSEAIKDYMKQQPNSGFVVKTYEDNMVNGLKLLLRMEQLNSYTEEFIKYYGSVEVILDTFGSICAESATQIVEETPTENPETLAESTTESLDSLDDYIDDSMIQTLAEGFEETTPEQPTYTDTTGTGDAFMQDDPIGEALSNAQTEELFLMIRGIACKLGVIDYDDTHTLSKADMKNAQVAIKTLSAMTVQEGMIGALALAETKEDLSAITRFLELFYTYLRENGLSR